MFVLTEPHQTEWWGSVVCPCTHFPIYGVFGFPHLRYVCFGHCADIEGKKPTREIKQCVNQKRTVG